jgi:hypothetical protein
MARSIYCKCSRHGLIVAAMKVHPDGWRNLARHMNAMLRFQRTGTNDVPAVN